MAERSFILRHRTAPGDITVMTALIRDIKAAYGDRFQVDVRTTFPEIWANNPYITRLADGAAGVEDYTLCYREGIRRAGRGEKIHFLTAFHDSFHEFSKIRVPISAPKPDLHLAPHEIPPLVSGRYWVILNGGKSDVTIKHWSYDGMQAVVSTLRGWGLRFVQMGGIYSGHVHINLDGVLNLVGQTNLRDMMNIIYNAEGVICPVTCAMHMAAAFERPCVVINGGREEPWWEGYTNAYRNFGEASGQVRVQHRFLHTVGTLDCCMTKGCWKKKVVKIDQDNELCYHPVYQPKGQTLPRCMEMITPDHLMEAIMSYYEEGTLPPIGQPKKTYSMTQPPPLVVPGPASKEIKPKGRIRLPAGLPPTDAPTKPQISPQTAPDEPVLLGTPWRPEAKPAAILGTTLPHLTTAPSNTEAAILDHPIIGGKVTICVLCYGKDHFNLHQRCLEKIVATVPKERMELRIGLNEVSLNTLNYVERLDPFKIYNHPENAKKYPVMREMFHDPAAPLTTNYLVWFDDDSYIVNEKWLYRLCETIIENHPAGNRLYGIKFFHQLQIDMAQGVDQRKWFQSAPWYKGRHFRTRQGVAAPNGDSICFVSGGFLALGVDAIKACDIPCARLYHNGGDITIGEQVWQGGFGMKDFNRGKELIYSSGAERRGYSENFPWRR